MDGTGGSITLEVNREALCCNAWDLVGLYQGETRLSFVHSGDQSTFQATFDLPASGGTFTFQFSSVADGWQMHDLGISRTFGPDVSNDDMQSLIPTYWWPTDACWDRLDDALAQSKLPAERVAVVLNPNSGNITFGYPDSSTWVLWRIRAQYLTSAGFRVLVYVNLCSNVVDFSCASTANQGDKPFSGDHGVKAEIDKYMAELPSLFTGIFFDDATHSGVNTDPILVATNYATGLGLESVHNPGGPSSDPVLFAAASTTVLREGATAGTWSPLQNGFPAEKSAMLLHSVPESTWRAQLDAARSLGYGYFYATSGGWGGCPDYLEQMLGAL